MNKTILSALAAMSVLSVAAKPIDEAQALKMARQFVGRMPSESHGARTRANEMKPQKMSFAKDYLHIFNIGDGHGFVVVAADDRVQQPILGYSDRGALSESEMPENMRAWLSTYIDQMRWREEHPDLQPSATATTAEPHPGTAIVEPLLGAIAWGQNEPYNLMTPVMNGRHTLTGCVATAMSQIMYYHRWPAHGTGAKSYYDEACGQEVSTIFEEHTYDWDSMTPTYDSHSSEAQNNAVAQLMFDAGVSVEMKYSLMESFSNISEAVVAMPQYFDYDSRVYSIMRHEVSGSTWERIMQAELDAHRPMLYSGVVPGAATGHAFVCDGYDSEGYYHFNWGWEGRHNGWFLLTTMNPDNSAGYTAEQEMVCNIAPNGMADDRPTDINVGVYDFDPATGQLTVTCTGDQSELENEQAYPWYALREQVKSVVFAEGITSIGCYACCGYPNLEHVTLPEGVERISYFAFADCPITDIELPQSLVMINGSAFARTKLTSVTFGRNIEQIINAFAETPTLQNFYVSAEHPRYTSVDGVLYDKSLFTLISLPVGRETFVFPEGVERVGEGAMLGSYLKELVFPSSISEIGINALTNCYALKSVTLPRSIDMLTDGMLSGCNALEELRLGPGLSMVGGSSLSGCSSLKEITFPAGLTQLSPWALYGCMSLQTLTCEAQKAPALGDGALEMVGGGRGTLRVPEGADYSSWLEQLGPEWTIQYFTPDNTAENVCEDMRAWVGYASSGYCTSLELDYEAKLMHSDVAIFVSNESNSIDQGLQVEGRTLCSLGIMGGKVRPLSGKAWISTQLPAKAEDADICVFDIDCSTLARFDYSYFKLPAPVVIPAGGCYIGFSFVSDDTMTPFNVDPQYVAGLPLENSCFVRSDALKYNDWSDEHHLYLATIKYQLQGGCYDYNVVPASAMTTSSFCGEPTTTTLSLSSLGTLKAISQVGVRVYTEGSWSEVKDYAVGKRVGLGAQTMIKIDLPASAVAGNRVDSVQIVRVNGFDNPSAHVAIPIRRCNVADPLPHRVLVNNYISKNFPETMSAFVSNKLLAKDYGDAILPVTSLKEDPVVYDFCSQAVFSEVTTILNEFYYQYYKPYYGLRTEGFGLGEEVAKILSQPATIGISAEASWNTEGDIIVRSQLHTLVDMDPKNYMLSYFVVADSLHGSGSDWTQLNGYAGTTTDDPNLAPLTTMPSQIEDVYYNNVCLWTFNKRDYTFASDEDIYLAEQKAGSDLVVTDVLEVKFFDFIQDPSMFGYQKKDVKVVALLKDNVKNAVINAFCCRVVPVEESGIESLEPDAPTETIWYDLSGRRVTAPQTGKIHIRTSATSNLRRAEAYYSR